MKIKTSELSGAALNYAVAVCEKAGIASADSSGNLLNVCGNLYAPSTDWAQGGPIIEREKIELVPCFYGAGWYARNEARPCDGDQQFGDTALIAAMRCYVASKLGDEVEVPEELE